MKKINLIIYGATGSIGKSVLSIVRSNREKFNIYIDNFIASINNIALSIENEDSESLVENFNIMSSNCGTCHKKFKN